MKIGGRRTRVGLMVQSKVPTNYHRPDGGLIERPANCDVGDTCATVMVANLTQDNQKLLEQRPATPRLHDHVKVLGRKREDSEKAIG